MGMRRKGEGLVQETQFGSKVLNEMYGNRIASTSNGIMGEWSSFLSRQVFSRGAWNLTDSQVTIIMNGGD